MPLLKGSVLDDAKNKVNIALSLEKLNILNALKVVLHTTNSELRALRKNPKNAVIHMHSIVLRICCENISVLNTPPN